MPGTRRRETSSSLTKAVHTSGRRNGRPKADDPRRAHSIHFSARELSIVKAAAYAAGEPFSVYVRERALLAKPPRIVPSLNRSDWAALGRLAGNLRQIASAVAAGRVQAIGGRTAELLAEACDLVRELRLTLLDADGDDT
jgi:hypothetical protein